MEQNVTKSDISKKHGGIDLLSGEILIMSSVANNDALQLQRISKVPISSKLDTATLGRVHAVHSSCLQPDDRSLHDAEIAFARSTELSAEQGVSLCV